MQFSLKITALGVALLGSQLVFAQADLSNDPFYYPYAATRNVVYGSKGMVATSNPLAAQAGLEILKKGYVPRDYNGDLKELQLTDYVYKGKIETREQLAQIVDSIFADNAPKAHVLRMVEERDTTVTESDTYVETRIIRKRYPKFEIRTIRQLIDEGKLSADSVAKEKQLTMEYIPVGAAYLEMHYSYKGKNYRAIALCMDDGPFEYMTCDLSRGEEMHGTAHGKETTDAAQP